MGKAKENIFDKFSVQRQEEQNATEASLVGKPLNERGRPRKRKVSTSLTLSISPEDKAKIKKYAFDQQTSVSDLLHLWINQKCK